MKKLSVSICACAALACGMHASAFKPMGYKATGMGGAGVASARGSYANYYNPALLGVSDYGTEIAFGFGASLRENNVADNIDRLSDLDLSGTIDTIADNAPSGNNPQYIQDNITESQDILRSMSASNGLAVSPSLSLGVQLPFNAAVLDSM